MSAQDPTADYRKYPKGPNFLGIVLGSCVAIIAIFVAVLLFLHRDAGKLMQRPAGPDPHSMVRPFAPRPTPSKRVFAQVDRLT